MYDQKFERTVRQKMDGLQFSPSGSVWSNIDKAIAGQRRRRRGVMVFLLPLLLLSGATGAFIFAARESGTSMGIPGSKMPAIPEGMRSASARTPDKKLMGPDEASPQKGGKTDQVIAATTGAGRTPHVPAYARPVQEGKVVAAGKGQVNEGPAEAPSAWTAWMYSPGLASLRRGGQVTAGKLATKTAVIAVDKIQRTRRPWEAGFTAGGGYSRLNTLKVQAPSATGTFFSTNGTPTVFSTPNAAGKHFISDVRPGAAFYAGIVLQKPIFPRLAIVLGMNLHYYSNRITTGQQVVTYVPAAQSGITPTVTPAALLATPQYAPGDEHVVVNKYYFLEAPVGLQWRVNRSPVLPLFLTAGGALTRLMGSNALFFDPHSGVYLKDAQVVEKNAVNLFGSLMAGLPIHGVKIQAGPEVEYGLSPLINSQSLGVQHLFYGGIRLVVLPGAR
jgi:hypothetical protein